MGDADVEPESLVEQLATATQQNPDERRKIRIQYRTLLNDVSS